MYRSIRQDLPDRSHPFIASVLKKKCTNADLTATSRFPRARLRSRLGADFSRDHGKNIFDSGRSSESDRAPLVQHFPGLIFLILLQIRAAGGASCPAPFLHQKDKSGKVSYQREGFQLWSCENRSKIGAQARTESVPVVHRGPRVRERSSLVHVRERLKSTPGSGPERERATCVQNGMWRPK